MKNALAQASNSFRSGCQLQKIVQAKVLHVDGSVVDFQGLSHFDHDGFKSSQSGPLFKVSDKQKVQVTHPKLNSLPLKLGGWFRPSGFLLG